MTCVALKDVKIIFRSLSSSFLRRWWIQLKQKKFGIICDIRDKIQGLHILTCTAKHLRVGLSERYEAIQLTDVLFH